MILELVEFNSPKGWTREQVAVRPRRDNSAAKGVSQSML